MDEKGLDISINQINNNKDLVSIKEQTNFLETTLGQTINTALDMGLRALLPNFVEDGIINIKNTILEEGFSEGIKTVINEAVSFGKSITGIFTGKFENVSQMQMAIEKGGIIDSTSNLLDNVLSVVKKKNILPNNIISIIKQGKNLILDNVNKNIESTITNQSKEFEKLSTYSENWKEHFKNKDFENMEKQYKKIEKSLKKLIPLEETIKQAREIENLHNLIKNNGQNFEISDLEKQLAQKLVQ